MVELAEKVEGNSRPSDLSKTAQRLIRVGLALRKSGIEPEFEGPFGLIKRPFATIKFGGETVTFGTQLTANVIEELTVSFTEKKHTAAREALRLGIIAVYLNDLDITGPLGGPRPFSNVNLSEHFDDEYGREALEEFRKYV
ncbi:hypothetical protein C453_00960 [Haloferax elongans ATCC BAA-1513]|uniref:Uncharacterized protein n=1 Tax=Haloferax elongans ATCC BAA-1513 TaxID=1230453 RepID=M0I075_HALEO|nr:hypothetical protein C453_00960 [Haloferax elongans ATCC BAA-1513]